MADQNQDEVPQAAIGALLASGFPFQTTVASVVERLEWWKVVSEEFPWRDDLARDQFLDLVASDGQFVVTIECKKTQKETMTFLQPRATAADITRARILQMEQILDSTKRMELFSADRNLSPVSHESQFCVVSTSEKGKDQRLLEVDARRLVRATDSFATHYKDEFKIERDPEPELFFLPVIVTNAELFIAIYDPSYVSLETGQFGKPDQMDIRAVDWVRFRKSFTPYGGKDSGARTVFVVTAKSLVAFLGQLHLVDPSVFGKAHFALTPGVA